MKKIALITTLFFLSYSFASDTTFQTPIDTITANNNGGVNPLPKSSNSTGENCAIKAEKSGLTNSSTSFSQESSVDSPTADGAH